MNLKHYVWHRGEKYNLLLKAPWTGRCGREKEKHWSSSRKAAKQSIRDVVRRVLGVNKLSQDNVTIAFKSFFKNVTWM